MDEYKMEFESALLSLDRVAISDIMINFRDRNDSLKFIEEIMVPVMEKLGSEWEEGKLSLSQIYMGGRICEELFDDLFPTETQIRHKQPKMAIVIINDYHLLGKRCVYALLRASGYTILDYGIVTDLEELVDRVKSDNIEILLISVLMLQSALSIENFSKLINNTGLKTKIIVGGAPFRFDKQLWQEVGANAMATNSSEVISVINSVYQLA